MEIKKIAVVGPGTMGSGIAEVCAKSGYKVILVSRKQESLDKCMIRMKKSIARGIEKGKLTKEDESRIMDNIQKTTDLKDAAEADLVIEAIPENEELKKELVSLVTGWSGLDLLEEDLEENELEYSIALQFEEDDLRDIIEYAVKKGYFLEPAGHGVLVFDEDHAEDVKRYADQEKIPYKLFEIVDSLSSS